MRKLKRLSPFLNLLVFYLIINFALRLILLFHPITQSGFTFIDGIKIFVFGLLSDFFIFSIAGFFLWLYLIFISNSKYHKPYGYIIFGLLIALLLYVSFGHTILNDYGGGIAPIGIAFVGLKTVLFGIFLF